MYIYIYLYVYTYIYIYVCVCINILYRQIDRYRRVRFPEETGRWRKEGREKIFDCRGGGGRIEGFGAEHISIHTDLQI